MSRNDATDRHQWHIVVVDDEAAIRDTLRDCLEPEGYRISEAGGGARLSEIMERERVDLILLDLRLREDDGLDIARDVLGRSDVSIIMVTAKGDPQDRVVGLELGADDYITKPFHVREVLARVRTVLRRRREASTTRSAPRQAEDWTFDGFVFNTARRQLSSSDGRQAALTTSEYDLLTVLLRHANRPLSRDTIMDLVKGKDWMANDRVIDNRILRLRRKLSNLNGSQDLIQSVRGVGYILTAKVERR